MGVVVIDGRLTLTCDPTEHGVREAAAFGAILIVSGLVPSTAGSIIIRPRRHPSLPDPHDV